jgi:site-specific DNA-methyltransferase (adenine-specific)
MSAYYSDDQVTLYHGDAFKVFPTMAERSVDAVITDPPYTERTHSKARSTTGPEVVTAFASITDAALSSALMSMGRVTRGWVIATLDYRHAVQFDVQPPEGLKCQRLGVWVKTNPTPQLTGDRPAQGWESIAYFHRADRRSTWNGGGVHGNYNMRTADPEGHPTVKPLPLVQDLVRKFTKRGDLIFDPFAGSGTTLRAAVNEGRRAVGVEAEERYCELIAKRLAQGCLDFEDDE